MLLTSFPPASFNGFMISVYVIMCHILGTLCMGWSGIYSWPTCYLWIIMWLVGMGCPYWSIVFEAGWQRYFLGSSFVCHPPFLALAYQGWLSKTFLPLICLDGQDSCDLFFEIQAFSQSQQKFVGAGLVMDLLLPFWNKIWPHERIYMYLLLDVLIHVFRPGPCWQIISNSTCFRND